VQFPSLMDLMLWVSQGNPSPSMIGADCPERNLGALRRYGPWRLMSNGPDREYHNNDRTASPFNPNPIVQLGVDVPYDPTNGTISRGNLIRTQKHPEGIAREPDVQ
ncbi:hypothetical protein HQ520_18765, partial [bacterium]|nr:hypothetical protein [bacterium]